MCYIITQKLKICNTYGKKVQMDTEDAHDGPMGTPVSTIGHINLVGDGAFDVPKANDNRIQKRGNHFSICGCSASVTSSASQWLGTFHSRGRLKVDANDGGTSWAPSPTA